RRFADRHRARSAGSDAVGVGALGVKASSQVCGWHIKFQFGFVVGLPDSHSLFREFFRPEFLAFNRACHHLRELVPILVSFAASQIHAKAKRVELGASVAVQTGIADSFDSRSDGEEGLPRVMLPERRIFADFGDAPIFDLSSNLYGEAAGI